MIHAGSHAHYRQVVTHKTNAGGCTQNHTQPSIANPTRLGGKCKFESLKSLDD